MPALNLSVDEVLTTTRAVRKRLDLSRPVEPAVIRECLELALQAPTPGDAQGWHFVVVTDPARREALAELYRRAADAIGQEEALARALAAAGSQEEAARVARRAGAVRYLTEHLHRVPVHVIPCLEGRDAGLSPVERAAWWGGIWPAAWSFMLAARSRGLGTTATTLHLLYEREAAAVLGVPYERVTQVALIPVAYKLGTRFRPAARKPLASVLHWDRW